MSMKKNKSRLDNVAKFGLLQDAKMYAEGQFLHAHLAQMGFWIQTTGGYRFLKWYAVIGDTVISLPWATWMLSGATTFGTTIGEFLGKKLLDDVLFFLSHDFELDGEHIVADTITQWHVTFDLMAKLTEMLN